jgi:hypothetical protein
MATMKTLTWTYWMISLILIIAISLMVTRVIIDTYKPETVKIKQNAPGVKGVHIERGRE